MTVTTVVHSTTPTNYYRVRPSCVESRPLYVEEYQLVKETPCYVYIKLKGTLYSDPPRKMLKGATRQFASPTLDQAYRSFLIKSKKYIRILNNQITDRQHQMKYAEQFLDVTKIKINTDGPSYAHPNRFTLDEVEFWSSSEELNKERTFQDFIKENP